MVLLVLSCIEERVRIIIRTSFNRSIFGAIITFFENKFLGVVPAQDALNVVKISTTKHPFAKKVEEGRTVDNFIGMFHKILCD